MTRDVDNPAGFAWDDEAATPLADIRAAADYLRSLGPPPPLVYVAHDEAEAAWVREHLGCAVVMARRVEDA
jgi:hypothetical protein